MTVDVLVEPIVGDRFRASTGEPFAVSAEGDTDEEAISRVRSALGRRIRDGAKLVRVTVGIAGPATPLPDDELTQAWVAELKRIRAERNAAPDPWDEPEVAPT